MTCHGPIRCPGPRASGGGFTLIELLAVIVIAALVTGLAAVSISATSERTAFVRTIATLRQLDARGRMQAQTSGEPVALRIDPEQRRIILVTARTSETLSEFGVPLQVQLILELPGGGRQVVFDTRGRSDDYAITARDGTSAQRLEFAGLSGEVVDAVREVP